MNFLEACRRLIAFESTPSLGNGAAAEFVGGLCAEAGLHVEYQRELTEGVAQVNVIARYGAGIPPRELLLQTHLDTVPPGHFGHWTETQLNPFNASIFGDEIVGLGVADAKLDFLCKLEALKAIGPKALNVPVVLVGTFGAQSGMAGAIKLMRRKKVNASCALIGEPTGARLVSAGMGYAVVGINIPFSDDERAFRRNHDEIESATSQSRMFMAKPGENAIVTLLEYLSKLPDGLAIMDLHGGTDVNCVPSSAVLELDAVAGFRDPVLPKLSRIYRSVLNLERDLKAFAPAEIILGKLRASDNEVHLAGSCRFPPEVTDQIYEGWMRQLEAAVKSEGASFRVKEYRAGFRTPLDGPLARVAQETLRNLNRDASLSELPVATEANVLSRLGVECLVWGPGLGPGNSHRPNERIKISELKLATEFYRQVIERFCA